MEWILILIGVGYSLWSSYKKDAKEREQKLRGPATAIRGPGSGQTDSVSGRRTLSRAQPTRDINVVPAARKYGQDVSEVREVSVEDFQEDFTSRLNRTLMEKGLRSEHPGSVYENFGELTSAETERIRDYDDLPSYDQRATRTSTEHDYTSHFKLNEGIRKHGVRVSGPSAFDELDIEEEAERVRSNRRIFTLDRASLQSYIVMHEVLGKPRSLRLLGRKR